MQLPLAAVRNVIINPSKRAILATNGGLTSKCGGYKNITKVCLMLSESG